MITYYATRLSENLAIVPESGFLICRDAVLARTGWQTYLVKDLPQKIAAEIGIDLTDQTAQIEVYRAPEDVFDSATIASFEGVTVCDGHPPLDAEGNGFVHTENFNDLACGHVQNVRKGSEALESGEWPLIGDLIITSQALIEKIMHGLRQLSCGYKFSIRRDGQRILQIGIVGNHVAVLSKGRAGAEARIYDSALEEEVQKKWVLCSNCANPAEIDPVSKVAAADAIAVIDGDTTKTKEKGNIVKPNWLQRVLGLGLKTMALDAEMKPEDLAEAAGAAHKAMDGHPKEEETAEDRKRRADDAAAADRKRADDKAAEDRAAEDRRRADDKRRADDGKDCKPGEDGHMKCTKDKCMAKDRRAADAAASDFRARMHAALDTHIDEHEKEHGPMEGEDADLGQLKSLFGEFMNEEEKEPEHEEGAADETETGEEGEGSEILEPVGAAGEEELMPANDSAMALLPFVEKTKDRAVMKAFDAALGSSLEDELGFLKAIRPAVARTSDAKVRQAFDAALAKFTRTSKPHQGGYTAFAGATARAHDGDPERRSGGGKAVDFAALDAQYAKFKGKNSTEVQL